ncbi:MAG: alpha-L-fucosidase [Deltaproteobacteria bacterium]|nr:alpha-L-fucosidase [Deltaproteobacteria bacterium]
METRDRTWFRQARYGMFIHYGLFSYQGKEASWPICFERIPFEEYKGLADVFDPEKLDIDKWAKLACESGMKYMCLTARHHDGFALWDSKASDFNSVKTKCGRDLVKEYVEACRRHGLRVGLYYSVADWGDEGFLSGPRKDPSKWRRFVSVAHQQLTELMSNYGKIDYLFYDGCPPPDKWGCAEINARIRNLQPDILISDRCLMDEDVKSFEQRIPGEDPGKLWETCMTINKSWGYNYGDLYWKSPREIIYTLITCAHNGGNLLLNVGPRGEGTIQEEAVEVLRVVGEWVEKNGDSLYGTEPHPFNYADQRLSTSRGNTAYIPLPFYHGPETTVAGIGNKVKSVRVLSTGQGVAYRQEGNRVFMTGLPERPPDPLCTVLAMELDGKPEGVPNPLLGQAKY